MRPDVDGLREEGNAAKLVGRILHYVGDSTIISPSIDDDLHDQMERECSRISPRQVIENLNLLKPIGKRETLKVLMDSLERGPASSALEAVKRTLSISFSIISSIYPRLQLLEDLESSELDAMNTSMEERISHFFSHFS